MILGSREVPVQDRLNLWPQHKAALLYRNLSVHTVRNRQHVLTTLSKTVDLADARPRDIETYLTRGRDGGGGLSPATRRANLAHLSAFYDWCLRRDLIDTDPTAKLDSVKVRQGRPRPMKTKDLDYALASATHVVRVWLMLMAYAGLRCMEVAGLHADNVLLGESPTLEVVGKGDRTRVLHVHPDLLVELALWPTTGYLFPGNYDGHVSAAWVSTAVNGHLRRMGIASTAHSARHLFATTLAQQPGADLLNVRDALGHTSVATTQIYTKPNSAVLDAMIDRIDYSIKTA